MRIEFGHPFLMVAIGVSISVAACDDVEDESQQPPSAGASAQDSGSLDQPDAEPDASAGSGGAGGGASTQDASATDFDLSSEERASLLFTREEEKLARDVYRALQSRDFVFENIAASEQRHMDAVATLLTRYQLPDPTAGKAEGEFQDAALQALYDRLTDEGSASAIAAVSAGLEIEELDIRDLEEASKAVTHADIRLVYDQLTRGSRNHLRAFYRRLEALGGDYDPKYLEPATFQEIAAGEMETGR